MAYKQSSIANPGPDLSTRVQNPDGIIANGDRQVVCSKKPESFTEANSTYMLAYVVMGGGDCSKGDDVLAVAAKSGVAVVNPGTARYVAILDTVGSHLLVKRKCGPLDLAVPGTVDIPAWNCFY